MKINGKKVTLYRDCILCKMHDNENDKIFEIIQNVYHPSFLFKKWFCNNPSIIFFTFLINTFQMLQIFNGDVSLSYYFSSHSITYYVLKLLEKNGLVNIVFAEGIMEPENILAKYYKSIGNNPRKRELIIYDILFEKCRSLTMDDMPLLEKIMMLLKIDSSALNFREVDGKLTCSINYNIQSIFMALNSRLSKKSGNSLKRVRKNK